MLMRMQRSRDTGINAMQREIYKIEDYKENRRLVYLDEDAPAFCLYSKEIRQFGLKEGLELTEGVYGEILAILTKRARERCLYLLDDMARTEQQIRKKLKEGYYPEEAIDSAIAYCKEKHYIDDLDYAERFIASKSGSLSRRMIEQKLYEKGIDRETASKAMEDSNISEEGTIRAFIQKKYGDISGTEYEGRQKIIRKLLTRGFAYDTIKQAMTDLT